jgi:hypothetical protein
MNRQNNLEDSIHLYSSKLQLVHNKHQLEGNFDQLASIEKPSKLPGVIIAIIAMKRTNKIEKPTTRIICLISRF